MVAPSTRRLLGPDSPQSAFLHQKKITPGGSAKPEALALMSGPINSICAIDAWLVVYSTKIEKAALPKIARHFGVRILAGTGWKP